MILRALVRAARLAPRRSLSCTWWSWSGERVPRRSGRPRTGPSAEPESPGARGARRGGARRTRGR
jgi:hypothetical protein